MTKKWYGKIIFEQEGCFSWEEFETEAEAKAYVIGAKDMMDGIIPHDECYSICFDQIKPVDE